MILTLVNTLISANFSATDISKEALESNHICF